MVVRVPPRTERELKMPVLQGQPEGLDAMPERREHARFTASSLSYIDLGEANGGLILNLSEGGVSVQAAEVLIGDVYPRIRFHLPKSEDWIDTGGRIVWRGKTKKEAGIRFVDMPPYTRRKIREWLAFEANQDPSQMTWHTVQPAQQGTWTPGPPADAPTPLPPPLPPVAAPIPEPPKTVFASGPLKFPVGVKWPARALAAQDAVVEGHTRARRWRQLPEPSSAPRFRLFDTGDSGYIAERGSEPRRWVLMTAVTCVVGVLCFIAGMSVRTRGALTPATQALDSLPSRSGAPVAIPPPSPVAPTEGQLTPSAQTNQTTAAGAPPGIAGVGSNTPGTGAAAGVATNPLAANPAAHRTIEPVAPGGNLGVPVLLNLEATAVGASAFVAITTRLSVWVPANFRVEQAQENNYLHVGDLVYLVEPAYPPEAIRDRVEGTVEVVAKFAADGTIERVEPYSGPDILSAAAMVAVRQWRYAPTYLYGHAIETTQHVKFVFRLPS
jgi:TonB family protein